jgi:hypothetical protein
VLLENPELTEEQLRIHHPHPHPKKAKAQPIPTRLPAYHHIHQVRSYILYALPDF